MEPQWVGQPYGQPDQPPAEPRQSGLGIASCAVSFLAGGAILAVVVLAVISLGLKSTTEPADFLATGGLLVVASFLLCIVSLTLGVAALFQAGRKKLFAIVGIVVSAGIIIIFVSLYLSRAAG